MKKMDALNELVRQQSSLVVEQDVFAYRDLNKNGVLDIYEDPRQPLEARVQDLLNQMTLAEKAGMLFINGSVVNEDGSIDEKHGGSVLEVVAYKLLLDQWMNHFNLWQIK